MPVLINLRSKSPSGSVALSGFSQGLGYAVAACGPLLVGVFRDVTGGWRAAYVLLLVVTIPVLAAAILLREPAYVEDELEAIARRMAKGIVH